MKVIAHQEKCVAAGQCAMIAPNVFDQRDEDGVVLVLIDSPPPAQHQNVRRAASACPAQAIDIEE